MGTTIYCLGLVYLAIADSGFDGDDDARELLWVKDFLNVGDDLGDVDVLDNCDDNDCYLLVVWTAYRRWWRS